MGRIRFVLFERRKDLGEDMKTVMWKVTANEMGSYFIMDKATKKTKHNRLNCKPGKLG